MSTGKKIDLAVLGAVPLETEPFLHFLTQPRQFLFHGNTFHMGKYGNAVVLIGSTGLGKVNAAMMTAALSENFILSHVLNVGCAGAYKEGRLEIGDVLISREVLCGDEGILTQEGVQSVEEIGIPILIRRGRSYYDRIPLNGQSIFRNTKRSAPAGRYSLTQTSPCADRISSHARSSNQSTRTKIQESLDAKILFSPSYRSSLPGKLDGHTSDFSLAYGPSLTVGMVSGDSQVAQARFLRYRALAENMEGSAVVQTCYRFGIPVMECRGVSNIAGDRSKDHWQIQRAMANCRGIVMMCLQNFCGA